ncbi:Na+/H+-dicarboxylate symporter [Natronincola peptidivorans]|uniref:Na+/H+-dicarboxylate symporter n=1 Tax=Natronincola peptidivorans TaxID=426128 RepID=A0A1I0GV84_9FIRM|nr:dicarboxylate/amino acid:cation symporter [Natronincola peptidivorans]SET75133.1 Na+/H+-dicarboxylate symporter [Natronincola peptidivorans]
MSVLSSWRRLGLLNQIAIGFILGIIIGLIFGPSAAILNTLGTILIRLLTMVVAPLVLSLLICAAAEIGDYKKLGRIGVKTVGIYMCTTAAAIGIGLVMANLFQVGIGVNLQTEAAAAAPEIPGILDTLVNIIPRNPFQALTEMNLLQIIFFALMFGFALTRIGEKGKIVISFFQGFSDTMKEITAIVLKFTPYGVVGLMATVVGNHGLAILIPFAKVIISLYIAVVIHIVVVQAIGLSWMVGKISPIRFLKAIREAALFVFATCSSVAAIPVTLKNVKSLGVSEKVGNFVVPFGAVINMDGTAIYQAIAAIFAAQIFGIELTIVQQLMIMLAATLASIGTAGVPGSGLVMLTIVLTTVGLPLEAIGLLAGIDRILNMGRVVANITGDAACAVAVARTEGEIDDSIALEV